MLNSVPGVKSANVDLDSSTATVEVQADVDPSALTKALTGQYSGKVKN